MSIKQRGMFLVRWLWR